MSLNLSRSYTSREGAPVIDRVDSRIFTLTYFMKCMACDYCDDTCCQYGADVDLRKVQAIEAIADQLEPVVGSDRSTWFLTDPEEFGVYEDADYPGTDYTRTRVVPLPVLRSRHNEEACVFLDPIGRGCRLHSFALQHGIDVHTIKPMICIIFPLSFAEGELKPALELEIEDLLCQGQGETLYDATRPELEYYFGHELVQELDTLAASFRAAVVPAGSDLISLPLRSS